MITLSELSVNTQTVTDQYGRTVADYETWIVTGAGKPDQVRRWQAARDALERQAAATIDPIGALLGHLHRGGAYAYYWDLLAETYTDPKTGKEKRRSKSTWFKVGARPAHPKTTGDMYFGVLPGTTAKGEYERVKVADVAAVNTMFAEFDAAHFVDVPDMDIDALANEILQAAPKNKLQAARTTAKEELQKQWAAADPERYKSLALAHIHRLPLQPSVIVDSGGGYHCYWLLQDPFILATPEDRAAAIQRQAAWVDLEQSDPASKDLARVLRAPGTYNTKYTPARLVTIIESDFSRLYDLATIDELLPQTKARSKTQQNAAPGSGRWASGGDAAGAGRPPKTPTPAEIAKAEEALSFLAHWRCVDYQGSRERGPAWLDVGMALFNSLGMAGLPLWDNWSKLCPEKYAPGGCAAKYDTFRYNPDGWHMGSLIYWAAVDIPPIETPEPPPPEDDTSEIKEPIPFEIYGPHRICGKRAKGKVYPKADYALLKVNWRFCGRNDCPVCARYKHEHWTLDILHEAEKSDLTIDVIGAETYTAATKKLTRDGIAWCSIIGSGERSTWVLLLTKGDPLPPDHDDDFYDYRLNLMTTLTKWLDGQPSEDVKPRARLLRSSRSIVKDGKTLGNAFFALKATIAQEVSNWAIEPPADSIAQLEQPLPVVSPEMQAWVDEAKDIPLSAAEFNALVKRLGEKAQWAGKGCTVKLSYENAETLVRQLDAITQGQKRGHSRWGVAA